MLRADVTNLDADATNLELSSLTGDCARLQEDLRAAQSATQVPSSAADTLWAAALGDFAQAITECPTGPNDHDVSKISEAAQTTSSGEITLTAMLSEIKGKPSG
jgi:hypothetical protein